MNYDDMAEILEHCQPDLIPSVNCEVVIPEKGAVKDSLLLWLEEITFQWLGVGVLSSYDPLPNLQSIRWAPVAKIGMLKCALWRWVISCLCACKEVEPISTCGKACG